MNIVLKELLSTIIYVLDAHIVKEDLPKLFYKVNAF